MGGVGKTALALKLAEQLAVRFLDAQFYIELRGVSAQPLSIADAMAQVSGYCVWTHKRRKISSANWLLIA